MFVQGTIRFDHISYPKSCQQFCRTTVLAPNLSWVGCLSSTCAGSGVSLRAESGVSHSRGLDRMYLLHVRWIGRVSGCWIGRASSTCAGSCWIGCFSTFLRALDRACLCVLNRACPIHVPWIGSSPVIVPPSPLIRPSLPVPPPPSLPSPPFPNPPLLPAPPLAPTGLAAGDLRCATQISRGDLEGVGGSRHECLPRNIPDRWEDEGQSGWERLGTESGVGGVRWGGWGWVGGCIAMAIAVPRVWDHVR